MHTMPITTTTGTNTCAVEKAKKEIEHVAEGSMDQGEVAVLLQKVEHWGAIFYTSDTNRSGYLNNELELEKCMRAFGK